VIEVAAKMMSRLSQLVAGCGLIKRVLKFSKCMLSSLHHHRNLYSAIRTMIRANVPHFHRYKYHSYATPILLYIKINPYRNNVSVFDFMRKFDGG
jgi:hypothetical protein